MKNLGNCLIVVDYQNDFVAQDGKLSAGEPAQKIDKNIASTIDEHLKNGENVFFTMDTHDAVSFALHPESAAFDLHCEAGSEGWELYGAVNKYAVLCENPEQTQCNYISKQGYSPSSGFIEHVVSSYEKITVVGTVTDICVFQTVIALYNAAVNSDNNLNITVKRDCVASFNEEGHKYALNYMSTILGVNVI